MWYKIKEISPNLYHVVEPGHVSFYILGQKGDALLIDSGLGIAEEDFKTLLTGLKINSYNVLATHLHCDHVGMNHSANTVYVNEIEWKKFQDLSDHEQILGYYNILKPYKNWPTETVNETKDFSGKVSFIRPGTLKIGSNEFEAFHTPGHTSGHMIYVSHKHRCIFLGDLIYDGLIFANLPDSDFDSYLRSLKELNQLCQKFDYTLLPSHNTIPLDKSYLPKLINVFEKIKESSITGTEIKENLLFGPSYQYTDQDIRVQVSKGHKK